MGYVSNKIMKEIKEMHKVYHKFQKWLVKNFGNDLYGEYKTIRIKQENGHYKSFKWRDYNEYELSKRLCGYEVMERIEKYVKRSCPEIKIVYCDDDMHATSIILLIPHPSHGITMMFIPQLIGIQNQLFLYGNHHKELMRVLEEMKHVYDDY